MLEFTPVRSRISISDLLNADGTDVLEDIWDNDLDLYILEQIQGAEGVLNECSENETEKNEVSLSISEKLKSLENAIYICEGQKKVHLTTVRYLYSFHRNINHETVKGMRQSKIVSFFQKWLV